MADAPPFTISALDGLSWLRYTITGRDASLPIGGDMSLSTGAADPEAIFHNRERALRRIGRTPESAVMCGLVHRTAVRTVDARDAGRGVRSAANTIPATDGLITREPGLALMMCFADCVPLLVVDRERRAIALAHAGWRGTLAGMAGTLVSQMREQLGSDPRSLIAVIGPSIGPAAYTVGGDVIRQFTEAYPTDELFTCDERGTQLDLWEANARQFARAGVPTDGITVAGVCTYEHGARLFSHRYALAHGEREGRFAVLMTIEG